MTLTSLFQSQSYTDAPLTEAITKKKKSEFLNAGYSSLSLTSTCPLVESDPIWSARAIHPPHHHHFSWLAISLLAHMPRGKQEYRRTGHGRKSS
jgi:hypothetical protein